LRIALLAEDTLGKMRKTPRQFHRPRLNGSNFSDIPVSFRHGSTESTAFSGKRNLLETEFRSKTNLLEISSVTSVLPW
jgi:hypothetical protein